MSDEKPTCTLCGEPMPLGEEMFKFHGYSGPCPKPPLPRSEHPVVEAARAEAERFYAKECTGDMAAFVDGARFAAKRLHSDLKAARERAEFSKIALDAVNADLLRAGNIILSLESDLKAAREAMEWRPIGTAPRDGTPVLLFAHHFNATASVRIVGHYLADDGWIAVSFIGQGLARLVPSFWQLLPEFPIRALPESRE